MPKDAKKNVDRYKVAGGHLNEFEFRQNQEQVKEAADPIKGVREKKSAKSGAKAMTGATAKKLAAKKAARK